jgi:hypothetical protein
MSAFEAKQTFVSAFVRYVPIADIVAYSPPAGERAPAVAPGAPLDGIFDTMLSKALAPAIECLEHGPERLALLGEEVLIAGRVVLV